jgi:hypothetical protein
MSEVDPKLAAAATEIENDGLRRFGKDTWPVLVDAVNKSIPRGVDPADVLKTAISSGDAAHAIARAGREALAIIGSSGNHEAEREYRKLRTAEREEYRKSRGR